MDLTATEGTLMGRLGIEWVETSGDRVVATMPVEGNTQPFGALHGGATAALIESAASLGATLAARDDRIAVCVDITVHHLRSVTDGTVTATAIALRNGATSVWDVRVSGDATATDADAADAPVAVGRCTFVLRERS